MRSPLDTGLTKPRRVTRHFQLPNLESCRTIATVGCWASEIGVDPNLFSTLPGQEALRCSIVDAVHLLVSASRSRRQGSHAGSPCGPLGGRSVSRPRTPRR